MFREVDLRIPNPERKQEGDRTYRLLTEILKMDQKQPEYMEKIHELFVSGFGQGSKIRLPFYCNLAKNIQVGKNVSIMPYFKCMSAGQVIIEDDVQIALDVKVITNNHDFYQRQILTVNDVHIKKGAWIGASSIILPGVTIGKYAVVGAGSVVTHDVPDHVVVAGNPARLIRTLDSNRFEE